MAELIVIIPTYDEKDNVRSIARDVLGIDKRADMLFVDDNSPDGTGGILDDMATGNSRIHVMHKPGKEGLGRAYVSGFKWALERDYRIILGMDADFSHDPAEIPNFVKTVPDADLILGSRYVNGIRITNWPLSRLFLSKAAATYVRIITGMPVSDPTGGYRCYRREVLESIDLDSILSNGYSFLVEMAYRTWMQGFRIKEIPITFVDRRSGYSKMSLDIFEESLWVVWRLAFRARFKRRPMRRPVPAPNSAGTPS